MKEFFLWLKTTQTNGGVSWCLWWLEGSPSDAAPLLVVQVVVSADAWVGRWGWRVIKFIKIIKFMK